MSTSRLLGKGAYSRVYADDADGADGDVAIKSCDGYMRSSIAREYAFSLLCNHQNIIKYTSARFVDSEWRFYMKKYQTDLQHFRVRGDTDVVKISFDLTNAVDYLHKNKIIHCDIKPANVLIDARPGYNLSAVLCDFGISTYDDGRSKSCVIVTANYRAPEIDIEKKTAIYSTSVDIWSLGCVYYYIITKKNLFNPISEDNFSAIRDVFECNLGSSGYKDSLSSDNKTLNMKSIDILIIIVKKLIPFNIGRDSRLYFISQLISFCLNVDPSMRSNSQTLYSVLYNAIRVDYPEIKLPYDENTRTSCLSQCNCIDEMNVLVNLPFEVVEVALKYSNELLLLADRIYRLNAVMKESNYGSSRDSNYGSSRGSSDINEIKNKVSALYCAATLCGESCKFDCDLKSFICSIN